jgi:O-succinylbenzoic acid--CoA ligase
MDLAQKEQLIEIAQALQPQCTAHLPHVFLATSGTTADTQSSAKVVALSYAALKASAQAVNQHLNVQVGDAWLLALPLFHAGGLGILIRASMTNSPVEWHWPQKWNAKKFTQDLDVNNIAWTSLVPTQVYDLVEQNLLAPQALRGIIVGGDHLSVALYQKARRLGWPLLPSYGMTETASQVATAELESLKTNTYPKLKILPHAKIQSDADQFLQIQSASLLSSYGQRQEGQIKIFDPKIENTLCSSDLGLVTGEYIEVLGREQDQFKVNGEGTHRLRLQNILEQITDCGIIFPFSSQRKGKEVGLILLKNQYSEEQVLELVEKFNQLVLPFERIHRVEYIENLPRNEMGKLNLNELRKRFS